jgi:23S rRNA pseudouridine2605 synthase
MRKPPPPQRRRPKSQAPKQSPQIEQSPDPSLDLSVDQAMRLHRYLAQCGVCARRKAEVLITQGKVSVNGKVVTELGTKVVVSDYVEVEGRPIQVAERGVLLLHKPRGVISTLSDPEGRPSLARYITKHYRSYFPVGRLDFESSGLIILTNDGELGDRLLHPRYQIPRQYYIEVDGFVSDKVLDEISEGVELEDGRAWGKVAGIDQNYYGSTLEITVFEGRNRLVRRLMDAVGHPVRVLTRMQHGPFQLGNLKLGEVKKLSEREYMRLRGEVMSLAALQS